MTTQRIERPLVIASSGGGGHIAAANNIMEDFKRKSKKSGEEIAFTQHDPSKKQDEEKKRPSFSQVLLHILMHLSDYTFLRIFNYIFQLPNLLPYQEFQTELNKKEITQPSSKLFVELMEDYSEMDEFISIYNYQQKNGLIKDIKKSINMQWVMDWTHRSVVRDCFFTKLTQAAKNGQPYTSLINTQAQGISGLCDAVIKYNKWIKSSECTHPGLQEILVEQYITDLLTEGATHYTYPLNSLSDECSKVIKVHYLDHDTQSKQWLRADLETETIKPYANPMVSQSFNSKEAWPSAGDYAAIGQSKEVMVISLGALGGGSAPLDYLRAMLNSPAPIKIPEHICIFRCDDTTYDNSLIELSARLPETSTLHLIPKQPESVVAMFMQQAKYLVIKPGGITCMNAMSMVANNHEQARKIIFHRPDNKAGLIERAIDWFWYSFWGTIPELQEGLSWENCNALGVKQYLSNIHNVTVCESRTADICKHMSPVVEAEEHDDTSTQSTDFDYNTAEEHDDDTDDEYHDAESYSGPENKAGSLADLGFWRPAQKEPSLTKEVMKYHCGSSLESRLTIGY